MTMTRLNDAIELIDWPQTRALLLDLDNTLYAYQPCHEQGLRACHEHLVQAGVALGYDEFLSVYEQAKRRVKAYTKGQGASHSRLLYFQGFFEAVKGRTEPGLSLEAERVYWTSFMERMRLAAGAAELLRAAKDRGARVCIVTDLTAAIQFEKLERLGIGEFVDYLVSSEEAGAEKPAPAMFDLALSKLNLSQKEVVLIGDDARKDGRGGAAAGIKTILVTAE